MINSFPTPARLQHETNFGQLLLTCTQCTAPHPTPCHTLFVVTVRPAKGLNMPALGNRPAHRLGSLLSAGQHGDGEILAFSRAPLCAQLTTPTEAWNTRRAAPPSAGPECFHTALEIHPFWSWLANGFQRVNVNVSFKIKTL